MSRQLNIINHLLVPLLEETDILVVGGGSAGCLAALGASIESNYKVTLVERYGFLGGTSTQMLDTFYGFFNPGATPRKIVGGLPDRIVNELHTTGDVFLRPNTYGAGTGVNYNPERLKYVWDTALAKAGVNTYLHTSLVEVAVFESYTDCIVWHKSGFLKIRARRVIDASGDADYCNLAGIPFELAGEYEPAQSMTTTFRMCGVDLQKFEDAGGKKMLQQRMKEAIQEGTHALPRAEGSAHEMCQPGCVSTVVVKVTDRNPLNILQMTEAEREGRRQSYVYEDFFRSKVPGYAQSKIIGLANQIGVRETRRVYGEYRLTREDCMAARIPADTIFLCGAPIEDHRKGAAGQDETFWQYIPGGGVYGVPYGAIVPKDSMVSWVVGRCFSATHDAHASCRSMAQTMSMGQAAGVAAVISLQKDTDAKSIQIDLLQQRLLRLGAVLQVPSKIADISRNGWSGNTIL